MIEVRDEKERDERELRDEREMREMGETWERDVREVRERRERGEREVAVDLGVRSSWGHDVGLPEGSRAECTDAPS